MSDFGGSGFEGATLDGVDLEAVNLDGASLHRSSMVEANLDDAHFVGAGLDEVDASGASFVEANLKDASLRNATLAEADLTGADLTGADLNGVDLRDATLERTDFTDADLTGANLTGALPSDATTEEASQSPVGSSSILAATDSLKDIPGVGPYYASSLGNAGYSTAEDIAGASLEDLTRGERMSEEMAKSLRLSAREIRGDEGTIIAEIAREHDFDRNVLADAYGSVVSHRIPLSEKLEALRALSSDPDSILTIEEYTASKLSRLHRAGFESVEDVAKASLEELTGIAYITSEADSIRSIARERVGYTPVDASEESTPGESEEVYRCDGCGAKYDFESVLRKHSYACGKKRARNDDENGAPADSDVTFTVEKSFHCGDEGLGGKTALVFLRDLLEGIESSFGQRGWFERFVWDRAFHTPYLGPDEPAQSEYVWIGFVDEYYRSLPRYSHALQFQFGISTQTENAFFGRQVMWGIYFGPWARGDVSEPIEANLDRNSARFARFLSARDEYVLLTEESTHATPNAERIQAVARDEDQSFGLTRDLRPSELDPDDALELAEQTFTDLMPLYDALTANHGQLR